MRGAPYTREFYEGEIERLTLRLTQPVSDTERVELQHQLASARQHLAEFITPRTA
jgi:hypothetical protein